MHDTDIAAAPQAGAAIDAIRAGLVVSCQASPDSPLQTADTIAAIAAGAALGGAVGLRINSAEHVRAVRTRTDLPIIGLQKVDVGGPRPFITPTCQDCADLVQAGASIVAIDASVDWRTDRALKELLDFARDDLRVPVMADVSTLKEGLRAWELGADLIGTTLSGYTSVSPPQSGPDFELLEALTDRGVRSVLEGRIADPRHVAEAYSLKAWSVVIGGAITDPVLLTRTFAQATPAGSA